jgi:hypothetical protein
MPLPLILVPKVDMETGADDGSGRWLPEGWSASGNQQLLEQVDTTSAFGTHSLRFTNPGTATQPGLQSSWFNVVAGRTYRWKFWAKAADPGTANLRILMKDGNGTTTIALTQVLTSAYSDWKIVERDFVSGITGTKGLVRIRANKIITDWYIDQISLSEVTGDSYHVSTPTERDASLSDVFMNTRYNAGGNVWFDVIDDGLQGTAWDTLTHKSEDTAWDILNTNARAIAWDILTHSSHDIAWDILNGNTKSIAWDILNQSTRDVAWDILNQNTRGIAWDILNESNQEFSWPIFARVLYFIQQFFTKAIEFNYSISEPQVFNKQILEPLPFTFHSTGIINDTAHLKGEVFDTITIATPTTFNFQIKKPVQFTFKLTEVLEGKQVEYPPA